MLSLSLSLSLSGLLLCLVLGVWVLRKRGKVKGNRFFFLLILVCSLNIYMIFSFWCVCLVLGVLVLRKCQKAKGYSFFFFTYFGMFSKNIQAFEFFFFFLVFAWCLVFGCWENVGKQREIGFFFSLICLVSKKLEATESQPNRTDWNPISSVLVLLPYGLLSVPNLVKSKISIWWKNRTSNRLKPTNYIPRCYIN